MKDDLAYPAGEPLNHAERQAVAAMDADLSQHCALTDRAFNLIGIALSRMEQRPIGDLPQSCKVATALLLRLSSDLRCAALVGLRGYALQAVSLVASMYECAYTIAAIGSDDEEARRWIAHDDPTRPFQDVRTMTRAALENLRVPRPDAQASIDYRVYRQLCMAKHANPLLQKQHGYQLRDEHLVAMTGPNTSPAAIRAAWFALDHAVDLARVALESFVANHIPSAARHDMVNKLAALSVRRKELEAQAIARGWGEDPFPERWRA